MSLFVEKAGSKGGMPMDVAILAGGKGTRLSGITRGKQKCLVDVQGRPFISLLLKQLKGLGLTKIFVMAGFDGQSVKRTVDSLSKEFQLDVALFEEPEPLGTGGCLHQLIGETSKSHVLVMNGDTFFEITKNDLDSAIESATRSCFPKAVIFGGMSASSEDEAGLFRHTSSGLKYARARLESLNDEDQKKCFSGWMILPAEVLTQFPTRKCDIENCILDLVAQQKMEVEIIATQSWYFDIGTPERLIRIQEYLNKCP